MTDDKGIRSKQSLSYYEFLEVYPKSKNPEHELVVKNFFFKWPI